MRSTYKELLQFLKELENRDDSRLDDTATAYINGEYYPVDIVEFNGEDDVLDDGHLFLMAFDWSENE